MEARLRFDKIAEANGISVREAAQRVGFREASVSKIEEGRIRGLRLESIAAICEEFGVTPDDFIELVG